MYFLVLGPSGIVGRLFGVRLLELDGDASPTWYAREPVEPSVEALSRQF